MWSQYTSKIGNQLGIQRKTEENAEKIVEAAKKADLCSGKNPVSMAAAAIYIASKITGEKKTQHEIARIAHVTELTIRNRCKELKEKLLFVITL